MLEPSFYFKVYLYEEKPFFTFIFKKIPGHFFLWHLKGSAVDSEDKGEGLVASQKAQGEKKWVVRKPSESCLKAKNCWLVVET